MYDSNFLSAVFSDLFTSLLRVVLDRETVKQIKKTLQLINPIISTTTKDIGRCLNSSSGFLTRVVLYYFTSGLGKILMTFPIHADDRKIRIDSRSSDADPLYHTQ